MGSRFQVKSQPVADLELSVSHLQVYSELLFAITPVHTIVSTSNPPTRYVMTLCYAKTILYHTFSEIQVYIPCSPLGTSIQSFGQLGAFMSSNRILMHVY